MSANRRIGDDPTSVDAANPFDSIDGSGKHLDATTAVIQRDNFRELPPGTVVGEIYEIDARLGAGAMGEVYAARHLKLGKRVAIKVIGQCLSEDDAAIERFAMEARSLAQIQHPAIVAVDHIGELADGRAFFSMELLLGEALYDRIERGRIPLPEALRILDQMARGLDAAHSEGITHRDLKPENTFLVHLPGEPPAVKLLDFGLAKLKRTDIDRRADRTQSGVAIGTPLYMSPEQMRGPDVDHRTDIYALGVVAYELILGQVPFANANTVPELYAAHLHEVPPLPRSIWPEIPAQLDQVLFAMLAKDPAHRPTIAQFRAVIAETRTQKEPSQHATTEFVSLHVANVAKQQRWTFAIITLVLCTLVGGITIGTSVGKHPSRAPSAPIAAPTEPTEPAPRPSATPIAAPSPPPTAPDPKPTSATTTRNVSITATPIAAPSPPPTAPKPTTATTTRNVNSTSPRQPPKQTRNAKAPVVAPTDAGIPVPPPPPPPVPDKTPPPKPKPVDQHVDRDQTINPFKRKANP